MTTDERARIRRYVERLDRQRATLADELADEVEQMQGLTMAERGEWIASVCRAATAALAARADARDIVLRPDPPAPDYAAIGEAIAYGFWGNPR